MLAQKSNLCLLHWHVDSLPLSHQGSSEQGLLSSCGARASHCCGFSCCRAWAVGHVGFRSCSSWALEHKLSSCSSVAPLHVGSSQIKYRTCVSWIGRKILYHWATREALLCSCFRWESSATEFKNCSQSYSKWPRKVHNCTIWLPSLCALCYHSTRPSQSDLFKCDTS